MDYIIKYLPEWAMLEIICEGNADVQGFKDYTIELAHHPKIHPKSRLLFDHRKLDAHSMSLSDIKEISQFLKSFSAQMKGMKQAILIYPHHESAKARIFQILTEDLAKKKMTEVRIFTDYDAAVRWLCSETYIEL